MNRLPRHCEVEVDVVASPSAVWAVLADVTRIGEWSHECYGARWLDGATAATPGARFRGTNRAGGSRWARVCEILAVEDARELRWRTFGSPVLRDGTEWWVRLTEVDGGTRIRQGYRVLTLPVLADVLIAALLPAHRDRRGALADDLRRLGDVAARNPVPARVN
ncbi:conserved hypothetical protein [Frankia canadensis]|uniref:Polyketide cyclase / dehydrase and lipid transport n=1 Tax=Frankia canadensis TaxID=1836972 RepID=A0A2I2KKM8_9ACTN|nr:SRPBCC family protein [Frankia canadensis]SNQ46229.1 conserved hypothetical protein [Frankia canadensis]SOU53519.1 conserved hypothetical protein [Frankia canadensis]